jgi:hypothetical protein
MGETRVDLLHLLEDLRDAYPGSLEETILTEIVANALDSGATRVSFAADLAGSTVTVVDDGSGMSRDELRRYHDLAASAKTRGSGIGFAGVGIKLGLLASEDVLTETRRGKTHVATVWRLASRRRAPWEWVPAPGLVSAHGTAIRLHLTEPLSALHDAGFLETTLRRNFAPLFDPAFDAALVPHYRHGVRFAVNGGELARATIADHAPIAVRLARKRRPAAVGFLFRGAAPLPEEQRGVAVSTLGKVIKRGWDWLGLTPAGADRVAGLIEAPGLAACLTLNKADFIRTGQRGMLYLAYRKAIQEAVVLQLAAWGDAGTGGDDTRRRKARPLERDLETLLVDLADDFPLLASLVERRPGGQRRLPLGGAGNGRGAAAAAPGAVASPASASPPAVPTPGEPELPEPAERAESAEPRVPASQGPPAPPAAEGHLEPPRARGPRRPARYTLAIQFESRPDDPALGRLVESTVWVNDAHPAYRRAAATRSEGYHLAVTVALALAPLAIEPAEAHAFVTAFLARWGAAAESRRRRS